MWRVLRGAQLRRRVAEVGVLLLVTALAPAVLGATAGATGAAPRAEQVSVQEGGGAPTGIVTSGPVVSADGTIIAFAGDLDSRSAAHDQVYLRDRANDHTELISVAADGGPADGDSYVQSMSADGNLVAFVSSATNLVGGNGEGEEIWQSYVRDRDAGHTFRIAAVDANHTVQESSCPALSADGRRLAFARTEGAGAVLEVVNLDADGTTSAVATVALPEGLPAGDVTMTMSGDGSRIAYAIPGSSEGNWTVHEFDIASDTEVAVESSTLPASADGSDQFPAPALSRDGQVLAYLSSRPGGSGTGGATLGAVMVLDLADADPQPVPAPGTAVDGFDAGAPSLSADGDRIAFRARRTTLDGPVADGVWVASRTSGAPAHVPAAALGTAQPDTEDQMLSADGSTVAFVSADPVLGGAGDGPQAFVADAPDLAAPQFGPGAALSANDLDAASVSLDWPAAAGAVTGYRLTRNGAALPDLGTNATSVHVTGLVAAMTYRFALTPLGADGATGEPLAAAVTTPSAPHMFAYEQVSGLGGGDDDAPPSSPSVSADGVLIAYLSAAPHGPMQVYIRDRAAHSTTLASGSAVDRAVASDGASTLSAIAGDGSVVAFASNAQNLVSPAEPSGSGIFLADITDHAVREIPLAGADAVDEITSLAISDDGSRLAYAGHSGDSNIVRVVNTAGGASVYARESDERGDPQGPIALSGDGGTIAFADGGEYLEAYALDDPDNELIREFCDADCDPSFSDDGRYLAYVRRVYSPTQHNQAGLRVDDLLVGGPPLQVQSPEPDTDLADPRLSADGAAVVFLAGAHAYLANPVTAFPAAIVTDDSGAPAGSWHELAASADTGVIAVSPDSTLDVPLGDGGVHLWDATRAAAVVDTRAPHFPSGAALTATADGQDSLLLTWPGASDDFAVSHYELEMDGAPLATLDPQATGYTVTHLHSGSTHTVTLTATDAAGNRSSALRAQATTLAQLSAAGAGPNSVGLRWDDATGAAATGLRVLRHVHGDGSTFAAVADLPLDATSHTDEGLTPDTGYDYRVDLVTATGVAPWSATATARTSALWLDRPYTRFERTDAFGEQAAPGTQLRLDVVGSPGQTATATLVPSDAAVAGVVVPLTEDAAYPGNYFADYRLDGAITAFSTAQVALTDGTTTVRSSAAMNLKVGGTLAVSIAASADPLPGLTLQLTNGIDYGEPVSAGASTTLTLDTGTWAGKLVTSDGDTVATADPVTITGGGTARLQFAPVRHTRLAVTVHTPPGTPAGSYHVSARMPDGTVRSASWDGQTYLLAGLPPHTPLHLQARLLYPDLQLPSELGADTQFDGGPQAFTLTATPLPSGAVTVTVTVRGAPLAGGAVTVNQHVDGRDWAFSGTTNAAGEARIRVLSGEATVNATGVNVLASGSPVTIPSDATVEVAFALLETPGYHVHPHVFTQQADGSEVEQPLDWRTAVHFGMRVSVPGGGDLPLMPDIVTTNLGGSTVQLCADGKQGGLSSGCVSAPFGDDQDIELNLHLTQAAIADASLVTESGVAYTGSWSVTVYAVQADGSLATAVTAHGNAGDPPRVGLPRTGDYVSVWHDSGQLRTAPASVHVGTGAIVHLGTLRLHPDLSGSVATVVATPNPAVPGALVQVRVDLPSSRIRAGDRMQITTAAGSDYEADGTTVDGAAAISSIDGEHGVSFPVTAGDAARTVIRYAFTVDADAPVGPVTSIVRLRHADGAAEEVGAAVSDVAGVALFGPGTVNRPSFTVSGTAPAGAQITLLADDDVAGHAAAGPGGRFTAQVTYAVPLSGYARSVVAATTVGGVELRSQPLVVTYDADAVEPMSATIESGAGTANRSRAITFDPRAGVASFTQVYVPGTPTTVTLTFADTSRIANFRAAVGSNVADGSCAGATCTANVATSSATVGDVYVDYDVADEPAAGMSAIHAPTAEELRHNLPGPFAHASAQNWDLTASSGTFTAPGAGDITITGSAKPVGDYTPTDEDVALHAATGVQAYDVSAGVSGSTLSASFALPTAWLNQRLAELNAASAAPHAALRPAAARPAFLRSFALPPISEGFLTKLSFGLNWTSIASLSNDLGEGIFGGGKFADLHDLDADIDALMQCNPQMQAQAHAIVSRARMDVIAYKAFDDAFAAVGLLGGSVAEAAGYIGVTALGLDGALGGIVSQIATWHSDGVLEQAQIDVAAAIRSTRCNGKTWHPMPRRKLASPHYIFDPSGYAYAGLADERVPDVTATLLSAPSADGPWTPWNAADFGQTNPQLTRADGTYGWDVPKGYYQVRYTKDGYRTVDSEVVRVLPERMDLNVDMLATAAPAVTGIALSADGATITLGFDRLMPLSQVRQRVSVRDSRGRAVDGTLTATDGGTSPDGTRLARSFAFMPRRDLPAGREFTVSVAAAAQDYAGVALGTDARTSVTTPRAGSGGGGSGGWPGGWLGGLLQWLLCRVLHLCA